MPAISTEDELVDKVLDGGRITPDDARELHRMPLEILGSLADALLIQKNEERRITNAESGSLWTARLARQAPEVDGLTLVRGVADDAKPGGVVRVRITGGDEYDLEAVTV